MKRLCEWVAILSLMSGGGVMLLISMWIEQDFEYAWQQFEDFAKKALWQEE